jgi:hypothetical protein
MRVTWGSIVLYLLLLVFLPSLGSAASLLVSWNANTESTLAGYRLYYGTQTGTYGTPVSLGKVTSHQLANLSTGRTYYVALTAYDTSGRESTYSSEVNAYIPVSQTQPALTLVSPLQGAVVSSSPRFAWSGTGFVSYKVYVSLSGKTYTRVYNGSGTYFSLSSTFWSLFIPSGSTIYWYVQGTTSGGQVSSSAVSYFKKQ